MSELKLEITETLCEELYRLVKLNDISGGMLDTIEGEIISAIAKKIDPYHWEDDDSVVWRSVCNAVRDADTDELLNIIQSGEIDIKKWGGKK